MCSKSRCLHAISTSHRRYWDLRRFALTRFISRTKGSSLQALFIIAVAALRFLYKITLHRAWNLEEVIPTPKKPQKLPIVLTQEEVLKFLASVRSIKHRTILTTCYAAGLRVSEAICLKVTDIDRERMLIRVQQGKGQKDRDVMLSPKLLEILRAWW